MTDEVRRDRRATCGDRRPGSGATGVIAPASRRRVRWRSWSARSSCFAPHPEEVTVADSAQSEHHADPVEHPDPAPDAAAQAHLRPPHVLDRRPVQPVGRREQAAPAQPRRLRRARPGAAVPVRYVNAPTCGRRRRDQIVAMFAAYHGRDRQSDAVAERVPQLRRRRWNVYQGWVTQLGQAGADLTSARPGHSEHQTGLAMDISARAGAPARSTVLRRHDAGPVAGGERVPVRIHPALPERHDRHHRATSSSRGTTGTSGVELATEMHDTGIKTLEEFFGLPAAPTTPVDRCDSTG